MEGEANNNSEMEKEVRTVSNQREVEGEATENSEMEEEVMTVSKQ